MRPFLLFTVSLLLAAPLPAALADTMYKCVDADGKTAYSSLPCQGSAKAAKEFAVPAPESQEASDARLRKEKIKLGMDNMRMQQQLRERNYELDARLRYGGWDDANGGSTGKSSGSPSGNTRRASVVPLPAPAPPVGTPFKK